MVAYSWEIGGFFSGNVSHPFQFDNSPTFLDHFYDSLTTLIIAFADVKDFDVFLILNQQILRANTVHIQHINDPKRFQNPFTCRKSKIS